MVIKITPDKYKISDINIDSTHILLKTDIFNHNINDIIKKQREIISNTIEKYPEFESYEPVNIESDEKIINLMTHAGFVSDTGPMASVAGSVSQICLDYLSLLESKYSIIENGGDIALKTNKKSIISIYAGENNYYKNLGFEIKAKKDGYGICTSSGTFGHSKSFGVSDATIVFSKQASIADGLATSIANKAQGKDKESMINNALEASDKYKEYYDGILIIKDDLIAKNGHIPKLIQINSEK